MAKLPRTSAKLTRQNLAPPRPIRSGSLVGSNVTIMGVDVTGRRLLACAGQRQVKIERAPYRARECRSLQRERGLTSRIGHLGLSPPSSEARLDEFVHLPRDGADIEQRLDPLASGAGKLGTPVGRV